MWNLRTWNYVLDPKHDIQIVVILPLSTKLTPDNCSTKWNESHNICRMKLEIRNLQFSHKLDLEKSELLQIICINYDRTRTLPPICPPCAVLNWKMKLNIFHKTWCICFPCRIGAVNRWQRSVEKLIKCVRCPDFSIGNMKIVASGHDDNS